MARFCWHQPYNCNVLCVNFTEICAVLYWVDSMSALCRVKTFQYVKLYLRFKHVLLIESALHL
jgi:hypothetical protein